MQRLIIDPVTVNDLLALQSISRQTFSETFSSVNSEKNMLSYLSESLSLEKLSHEINTPGTEFYFASIGKQIIGYLKLNYGSAQTEIKGDTALEIERIYVLQEFQGLKFGQSLFQFALQRARYMASDYVWLGVWEKNEKAIRFYLKNGFTQFGTHLFKLGEDEQTDLMMKLELYA